MAIYTNLPVFEETYQLLKESIGFIARMQRDFRYDMGSQLKRTLLDMCVLIYRANQSVQKFELIREARCKLVEVKLLLRLFNELKHLSDKQFAATMEHTVSISKQLTAWEKSTQPLIKQI